MLSPSAIDAIRKPPAMQPPAATPLRGQTLLSCDTPPTNDLQIFWQQLLPNHSALGAHKSGMCTCNCRHCCDMECSKPCSTKRAIGERKASLDNANILGGSSSTTRSGGSGGAASRGSGSGKGRRQLRRRSKKGADGRTTDSTGSPPTAPSVAAPRFTRNFDHLRLLLDAFQAVLGVNGGESATNETAAAASNERAPLMVLHDLLARQRRPNGTAVLSRDNGDAVDEV